MNMAINAIGLVAGASAFLSIWMGHVMVRKVEARAVRLWQPMLVFFILGLALEIGAALSSNRILAMVLGIVGFSLLWDVLELKRQEKRIRKGHAPANLENPRHVALLAGAPAIDIAPGLQKPGFPNCEANLAEPKPFVSRKQA